jgi:hypothetical protein
MRGTVVTHNKYAEYCEGEAERRDMCFLGNLKAKRKSDMQILSKWVEFFREIDIPFCVVSNGKNIELWKLRRV